MSHYKDLALDAWANSMQNQINALQPKDIDEISFCNRHTDPDWLRINATGYEKRISPAAV